MSNTIIQSKNIQRSFTLASGEEAGVLQGVDLRLSAGESAAIVGSSGCGKSTLLQILGLLDQPSSGELALFGQDVQSMPKAEWAAFRNKHIGFVFQLHHLLPQFSALENVLLPCLASGDAEAKRPKAEALLERVGLQDRLQSRPNQLSGGERQRVAVARALIQSPGLILADEPTGALDGAMAEEVMALLLELQKEEGAALLLVTHDLQQAGRMDRCWRLEAGELAES